MLRRNAMTTEFIGQLDRWGLAASCLTYGITTKDPRMKIFCENYFPLPCTAHAKDWWRRSCIVEQLQRRFGPKLMWFRKHIPYPPLEPEELLRSAPLLWDRRSLQLVRLVAALDAVLGAHELVVRVVEQMLLSWSLAYFGQGASELLELTVDGSTSESDSANE
jgi:hypothetical protein